MQKDGNVRSIYCHSDGYLSYNGRILLENYSDMTKLNALMDQGDCSSLGPNIGEKHPFDSRDKKCEDMCKFYSRDRGESDVSSRTHENVANFWKECDQEFVYLFKDGKWLVSDHGSDPVEMTKEMVQEAINEEKARYDAYAAKYAKSKGVPQTAY